MSTSTQAGFDQVTQHIATPSSIPSRSGPLGTGSSQITSSGPDQVNQGTALEMPTRFSNGNIQGTALLTPTNLFGGSQISSFPTRAGQSVMWHPSTNYSSLTGQSGNLYSFRRIVSALNTNTFIIAIFFSFNGQYCAPSFWVLFPSWTKDFYIRAKKSLWVLSRYLFIFYSDLSFSVLYLN